MACHLRVCQDERPPWKDSPASRESRLAFPAVQGAAADGASQLVPVQHHELGIPAPCKVSFRGDSIGTPAETCLKVSSNASRWIPGALLCSGVRLSTAPASRCSDTCSSQQASSSACVVLQQHVPLLLSEDLLSSRASKLGLHLPCKEYLNERSSGYNKVGQHSAAFLCSHMREVRLTAQTHACRWMILHDILAIYDLQSLLLQYTPRRSRVDSKESVPACKMRAAPCC